jgi:APA family basic amino acid/polyamine antiporter
MFAYMGFETTVRLTKEAKNPERDIPLALITSIITSTILYVAVSWIVTNVVGLKNLSKSATPVEDAANVIFGNGAGPIFSFIAFISISNTILLNLLSNSRMLHSLSEEYKILEFLKPINKTTQTPVVAIVVAAILSIIALLFRDIEKTAVFTTSLFFIILALVNMSLVVLHFKGNHDDKFAKTFTGKINNKFPIIPIMAFLSCIGIMSCCIKT